MVLLGGYGAAAVEEKDALHLAADKAIADAAFDAGFFERLRKCPDPEKALLLARFTQAASSQMRQRAVEELVPLAPELAGEAVRGFADDKLPEVSTLALAYLYLKLDDKEAEKGYLDSLASPERARAVAAGRALALFPDVAKVGQLYADILLGETYPLAVRGESMMAAGDRGNRSALPVLFQLLGDPTPLQRSPDDTMRLCDLAAQTIARIYQAHRIPMDAYYRGSHEVRDRAIAQWQAWAATQADVTKADPQAEVAAETANDALQAFSTDDGDREAGRAGIVLAFSGNMCLGILPGIDEVILPSVRDFSRMLSALGPSQRNTEVRHWDTLDLRLRREFLPQNPDLSKSAKDAQAVAFIRFVVENPQQTGHPFPLDWAWSFCRNFPEVFPTSEHRQTVKGYGDSILARIKEQDQMIVMHGTLPELEPIPKAEAPPKPGGMVQIGLGDAARRFRNEPSEWRHYRDAVACLAHSVASQRAAGKEVAPYRFFENHMIGTYPANEVPLLGEAALHLRAWSDPATALAYARKAEILNPGNPKVHAILGMIHLQFDPPRSDEAFAALRKAVEQEPGSIGGEPESQQAVDFLLQELEKREGAAAANAAREGLKKALAHP
jgi:hypothetical protein